MTLMLGIVDYAVIAVMLSVSAGVGVFFRFTGGKQKTTEEFLMAGKDMAVFPVAFSLMATYMSAISVLGLPSEVYMYGVQFAAWVIGLPLGSVIAAYLFLPIFFDMDACSAYEYLERRFGKVTRSIVSMLFILQMILYMSVVLYAPSLALNAVTGLSTWASVVSLAVVCTFYCSLGGLKAVLWTDVFQALLMYIAIIAIVVKAAINLGGMDKVIEIAQNGGRIILDEFSPDLTVRYTLWNSLIYGVLFAAQTFGSNQAQIQRMLSVRSLKRAQSALFLSVPLIIVFTLFCSFDGVVIYALFHDCDPILDPSNSTISSPDQLVPFAIMTMFAEIPGLSGLCICGVFGASLSTISSAMNSMTAVTIEDFIKPYCVCKRLTESWTAFVAKIVAIGYGCFCLLLTVVVARFRGIIEASNIFFGMVGGPVLGVFVLGMCTTTANEEGTLIGLLIGIALNAWLGFGSYSANIDIPSLIRRTDGCNGSHNDTLGNNFSTVMNITSSSLDTITAENEEYVLPIYKISFLWFSVFSNLTVLIVGYTSSLVLGYFTEKRHVKEMLISPIFRKWYFPPTNDISLTSEKIVGEKDTV